MDRRGLRGSRSFFQGYQFRPFTSSPHPLELRHLTWALIQLLGIEFCYSIVVCAGGNRGEGLRVTHHKVANAFIYRFPNLAQPHSRFQSIHIATDNFLGSQTSHKVKELVQNLSSAVTKSLSSSPVSPRRFDDFRRCCNLDIGKLSVQSIIAGNSISPSARYIVE